MINNDIVCSDFWQIRPISYLLCSIRFANSAWRDAYTLTVFICWYSIHMYSIHNRNYNLSLLYIYNQPIVGESVKLCVKYTYFLIYLTWKVIKFVIVLYIQTVEQVNQLFCQSSPPIARSHWNRGTRSWGPLETAESELCKRLSRQILSHMWNGFSPWIRALGGIVGWKNENMTLFPMRLFSTTLNIYRYGFVITSPVRGLYSEKIT
jgi:hypothetical protein